MIRGAPKRRSGTDGTYLEESKEVPGVLVFSWRRIVELASLKSCKRRVDRFKAEQSKLRQETNESNSEIIMSTKNGADPGEIIELKAEAESLKQKFADMEKSKAAIAIKNGLLTRSADNYEALMIVDLRAELETI